MVFSAAAAIALLLLGASGVGKLVDWKPTSGALKSANLPSSRRWVWLLGSLEIGAAAIGLLIGGVWMAPALLLYAGFTGFTVWALRRDVPLQSCGCFGKDDTPPTAIHVVYNAVATAALGVAAVTQAAPIDWTNRLSETLLFFAFAVIGSYLSYLLLAELPKTLTQARP